MKVVLARIVDFRSWDEGRHPYLSFTYIDENAAKSGSTHTPHVLFSIVPKSEIKGSVRKGDLVEVITGDREEFVQFKHLPLKQQYDMVQEEMRLNGGHLREDASNPHSALQKMVAAFISMSGGVRKKTESAVQYEFDLQKAA
jgi:hypothetical protein